MHSSGSVRSYGTACCCRWGEDQRLTAFPCAHRCPAPDPLPWLKSGTKIMGSGDPARRWKIRTSHLADADTRPVVSADHGSCRPLVARRLPQAPTQGGAVATLTPDGSCLRPHCPTAPFVRFPDPMIIDSIRYPITMCIRPFPEQHVGVGSSRFVHPAQRSAACDPTRVYLTLQHPSSWPRCAHPEFSGHFFCYRPPRWKHNPSSSMRTISTHR